MYCFDRKTLGNSSGSAVWQTFPHASPEATLGTHAGGFPLQRQDFDACSCVDCDVILSVVTLFYFYVSFGRGVFLLQRVLRPFFSQ